jgi:Domain of unknown function (DUF4129)
MSLVHFSPYSPDSPPLDPTAAQARAQLAQELSKPQYTSAQPSPLQSALQKFLDWVESLFNSAGAAVSGGGSALIVIVIVVVAAAAIIVGFLVFGLPRINQRSKTAGGLFGDDDDRDSSALRRAADQAAESGDFATAIEEEFRAIARNLSERVIVTTFPGTTAHGFAIQAATAFPEFGGELAHTADVFDAVRYLGSTATEGDWLAVKSLEERLRAARPALETADA